MILVNIDYIPGKEFDILGLVKGSMIQSKHIGKDLGSAFKSIVGGELSAYSEMINESRSIATQRMVKEAELMGADAIICIRYMTTAIMQGAAEILSYGTAVKFK